MRKMLKTFFYIITIFLITSCSGGAGSKRDLELPIGRRRNVNGTDTTKNVIEPSAKHQQNENTETVKKKYLKIPT
tara:strand:+ start:395 stop:619 length:225 start_codon:yes stop_codon:yes gene_type:complete